MRGPELYGRVPSSVRWSGDSKWIYFMWLEPGSDWRERPRWFRVRPAAGAKPEKVSPAQFDSVGALVTAGERSSNGRYIAVEYDGDIYVTDTKTGTTRRLTQTLAREHDPSFAVDASRVFFVRDNNVFSVDLNGGLVRQLTDLRSGPEPVDSAKATGQRGRLEQQQRDSVRGDTRQSSRRQHSKGDRQGARKSRAEDVLHAARREHFFAVRRSNWKRPADHDSHPDAERAHGRRDADRDRERISGGNPRPHQRRRRAVARPHRFSHVAVRRNQMAESFFHRYSQRSFRFSDGATTARGPRSMLTPPTTRFDFFSRSMPRLERSRRSRLA